MTDDAELMSNLGALFTEAVGKLVKAAMDATCGDRDLATALLHAAYQDMEAVRRADFIGAVYEARKKRSAEQEG